MLTNKGSDGFSSGNWLAILALRLIDLTSTGLGIDNFILVCRIVQALFSPDLNCK